MPKLIYEQKNFSPEVDAIIDQAEKIVDEYEEQGYKLTLRQLYYQFVARGFIPNTEQSYKRMGNIISDARRAGRIDWLAIEDRTRFLRQLSSWKTPQDILRSAEASYHNDLWANQDWRVEVWVEKDALVGVLEDVCNELDVPYFACRGYVSDSEMWQGALRAVNHIKHGQSVIILHLGDHDPSGIDMTRDITDRLQLFAHNPGSPDLAVERIALTMDQIEELSPPPNPAKISDSRYTGYVKKYGTESWELDALEPQYIVNLIQENIFAYRDVVRWQELCQKQEDDRQKISQVTTRFDEITGGQG